MEHKLEWLNEEEGTISFFEANRIFLQAKFFTTGPEEAEFRIQDIVLDKNESKNVDTHQKIISKVTECVLESFRLLWEEGLEETVLVEQNGSEMGEILNSTPVVQKRYSEFMMKNHFEPQKSTGCGGNFLYLTKTEDGYECNDADKTFFCRVLNYTGEQPGEACYYLYEVEVAKKKRNRGIATACLTELFRVLAENQPVTIYLQVGSYNEPAVHLYRKLGFETSEELCYYAPEEE